MLSSRASSRPSTAGGDRSYQMSEKKVDKKLGDSRARRASPRMAAPLQNEARGNQRWQLKLGAEGYAKRPELLAEAKSAL